MTLENYLHGTIAATPSSGKKSPVNDILNRINTLVDALMGFKDNPGKRLNITKLGKYLRFSPSEIEDSVELILKIQTYVDKILKGYEVEKVTQGASVYLKLRAKSDDDAPSLPIGSSPSPPEELTMSDTYKQCFNDLIYVFKRVKKGSGFDVSNPNKDLINKLLLLKEKYPPLFERRENGLIYPSKVGMKLGEAIITSNKTNRELREVSIEGITIKFE